MVMVITGGSREFDALAYAPKHPNTVQFLQDQAAIANSYLQQPGGILNDAAKQFYAAATQQYEFFNGAEALARAQAAIAKVKGVFQPNSIRSLNGLVEIQTAPIIMQRYLMAEPTVRNMFNQQRLDGYSDTYLDVHPGKVGEDHYDYRRVMDGMVNLENNEEPMSTHYIEELLPGDRELTFDEQRAVIDVWAQMRQALSDGIDPTSQFGGTL